MTPVCLFSSVTCVVMQKNGAGLHMASSCYWDSSTDGLFPSCHSGPLSWIVVKLTIVIPSRHLFGACFFLLRSYLAGCSQTRKFRNPVVSRVDPDCLVFVFHRFCHLAPAGNPWNIVSYFLSFFFRQLHGAMGEQEHVLRCDGVWLCHLSDGDRRTLWRWRSANSFNLTALSDLSLLACIALVSVIYIDSFVSWCLSGWCWVDFSLCFLWLFCCLLIFFGWISSSFWYPVCFQC